jgi:hypothetical protein
MQVTCGSAYVGTRVHAPASMCMVNMGVRYCTHLINKVPAHMTVAEPFYIYMQNLSQVA